MNTVATPPPPVAVRPQPPRQQYLDLKAGVHRKLLNRLNLEALLAEGASSGAQAQAPTPFNWRK